MKEGIDIKKLGEEGEELFQNGDYDKAEELFSGIVAAGYNFADVYNKLGLIYFNRSKFDQAAHYFEKALDINPRYTEAALNLAITYNEIGQYEKARDLCLKAKDIRDAEVGKIDPFAKGRLADLHFKTGNIYYEMGMLNEAAEEYRKAIALRPDFIDVRVKMGIVYREKGMIDKAIHEFKEAKVINPNYPLIGINLGITYYSISKFKLAGEEFRDVLKKYPQNKTARMYMKLVEEKL